MIFWLLPWRCLPAPYSVWFFSAAFGGRSKRVLRPRGRRLVFRQSAAANRYDSGWILFCFAGTLVEARSVPPWIFIARVIVVKWLTRAPAEEQTPLEKETSNAP